MNDPNDINMDASLLTANYLPRPRIDKVLEGVAGCKLVYVIAGAGYGKTQAVYHYVKQQQDAVVRWVQLAESDNVGSHYWENLTHSIAFDNPDLSDKLRELGFPETLARFKQFAEILKSTEHRSHKTFLVLDDFHLIHSRQALAFAERCAHLQIPGACVIIISRKEPEINAVSLFSKGKAGIITEDELCYTTSEIAEYLSSQDIQYSANDLPRFLDATKGWALAIKLLFLILKRKPKNLEYAFATMRQNVFRLMETEAWAEFPENVRKILVRLSLASDLPLTPLRDVFDDASLAQFEPQLTSFIWFDSFIGDYRVHPLYLEFIRSKHHILSDQEKLDTYSRAAQWCCENGFYTGAINYYAKSYQYGRMLEILFSNPFKLPADTCEFFLKILENIDPDNKEKDDYDILFLKNFFVPILLIGMDRLEEARERSFAVIREWENIDSQLSYVLLQATYSNLTYIDLYTCTATHEYNAPEYIRKSLEYRKLASMPPTRATGVFSVADIRSFACLVGEGADLAEIEKFLETARETASYIEQTPHGMYYGYDDLIACELAFFRNQLDFARNHAHNAIMKAREKNQYSIEMMAQYYLLRIAISEGDYALTRATLLQLRTHLGNPDFWNRQLLYDLFTGSFYCFVGLPEMAPSWLAMDEKETRDEVRIPVRELIVSVRYHMAYKKYKLALALLSNSYPRPPQERFLFGELILSLLFAVVRLETGDEAGAIKELEKAYEMSFDGEFEMPFIELGRAFRPLFAAVAKQGGCRIPGKWLIVIERKASVHAKRAAVIVSSVKIEENIKDNVHLSEREREILNDLYQGLSREEIATTRYLSINTIKKVLQSIYIKLDANNNVDAIRIAIEKKLIE